MFDFTVHLSADWILMEVLNWHLTLATTISTNSSDTTIKVKKTAVSQPSYIYSFRVFFKYMLHKFKTESQQTQILLCNFR